MKASDHGGEQRENILRQCRIKHLVCDLITDRGYKSDVVLVERLGQQTTKHPKPSPYKLSALENSKAAYVRRQCMVAFKIGSHNDELCDVVRNGCM